MHANGVPVRKGLVVIPTAQTPADRSIDKRRLRKHAILNVLRRHAPLSRAEVAKETGFNMRTTSMLIEEMVREELILEHEAVETPRGRRPTPLSLNARAASVLGIDIGRNRTIGRLMDLGGGLIVEAELQTPPIGQAEKFAGWALRTARRTIEQAGGGFPPVCGIGVGIPDLVERNGENALFDKQKAAGHIRRELMEEFGIEVLVDVDVRLMSRGSLWFGAGRDYRHFAVLKLGAGLGLGVVIDNELMGGGLEQPMELGHTPMGAVGARCYCGASGCLETVTSGIGIERLAREAGLADPQAPAVAEAARTGDKAALRVFDRFAEGLGRAVATVVNLYAPEAVILSGRLTRAADLYVGRAREVAGRHALGPRFRRVKLIVSDPNARLGALGSVAIVYDHIFHSHHVDVDEVL